MAEDLRGKEENGVIFADQWNNLANARAHYETTGPEIWEQTDGTIDAFICSIGTGGTIAGTTSFLREKKSDVIIILDHVNDQSNIGSIMRSCALFNCKTIIVSKNNSPDLTPSLTKSASGAVELINYLKVTNLNRTLKTLKKLGYFC